MSASPPIKPRITKDTAKPVLVYFPVAIIAAVDGSVAAEDTDRSKWIRKAIREALMRRGIAS